MSKLYLLNYENDAGGAFEFIKRNLEAQTPIEISFLNLEHPTLPFLHEVFGQLYSHFSVDTLNQLLTIVDITNQTLNLLNRVLRVAKFQLQNPDYFKRSIEEL